MLGDLPTTAVTGIEAPRASECIERRLVGIHGFALEHHLIPVETQPGKIVPHGTPPFGPRALGIQVFQAQDQPRPGGSRIQPAEQGGQQRARVGGTRGRRRETTDLEKFTQGKRSRDDVEGTAGWHKAGSREVGFCSGNHLESQHVIPPVIVALQVVRSRVQRHRDTVVPVARVGRDLELRAERM